MLISAANMISKTAKLRKSCVALKSLGEKSLEIKAKKWHDVNANKF